MVLVSTTNTWTYQLKPKKSRTLFNPNKGFFELWVVRGTFLIITLLSCAVIAGIYDTAPLVKCYTAVCFNNTLINYKVPLGIFSTLIPIIAVYAANHRSEQTKRQIELSQEQNNFTNYYKHLEEFEKYFDKVEEKTTRKGLGAYDARSIHNIFFPDGVKGNLHTLAPVNEMIEDTFQTAINVMLGLERISYHEDSAKTRMDILDLCEPLLTQTLTLQLNIDLQITELSKDDIQGQVEFIDEEPNLIKFQRSSISLEQFTSPLKVFSQLYMDVSNFIPIKHEISGALISFQEYNHNPNASLCISESQPFYISNNRM